MGVLSSQDESDLLDEADEPTSEHELSEERIHTCVSKFFGMLDRVVTVLRVYPRHHPVIDSVTQQAVNRLQEVLDAGRPVTVELTPSQVLSEWGEEVFSREMSESERFIWYKPNSDGLRFLTFRPGLDAADLQQLMQVVTAIDSGEVGSDDDTITLLWEKQLDTIAYRSVDTFVDSETIEEFNQRTSKEVVDMVVEAAIEPDGESGQEIDRIFEHVGIDCLDWFTAERVGQSFLTKPIAASEDDLAFALSVTENLVGSLYTEWHSGSLLEFRFIEALLSVIRTSPTSLAAEHARMVIEKMTVEMLDKEMYAAALHVLRLLQTRTEMFERADENPIEAVFASASEPERVEGLLWQLQKSDSPEPMRELLTLLDADAVQRRTLAMLSSDDTELAHPERLIELLVEVTDESNADAIRADEHLANEPFLERLLDCIPPERLADWAPAQKVVVAAIATGKLALQRKALELDFVGWADMTLARSTLFPLIDHHEQDIRTRTYELLGQYQPQVLQERLRRLLEGGELGKKPMGEIRFLMQTFVEAHPSHLDELRNQLDTRGWFGEANAKCAKAAARILLEKGDAKARATIEALSNSLLTAPGLKDAYKRLLQSHAANGGA
ncbi:hypothetical protein FIV42_16970 [Persicimonas caeni]|uniref:HEAT repeat domain-containing protein n=1 Tax=Persicimonas caeni TaxID=2292766 RepID=A0A4Y6PVJ5_PERCE|nr:hypothetical protein [Persicimonas caeni]QDG52371.1 hypothetical protein FIV42_16970 [Persicimonas caeni]QED33593.1 hypothetical protein FRD00_16965 [Persicimonas caeni]